MWGAHPPLGSLSWMGLGMESGPQETPAHLPLYVLWSERTRACPGTRACAHLARHERISFLFLDTVGILPAKEKGHSLGVGDAPALLTRKSCFSAGFVDAGRSDGWDVAAGFHACRLSVALEGWFPWSGWAGPRGLRSYWEKFRGGVDHQEVWG